MTTVEIGHNVRRWTTYSIKDATPGEVALLRQHEQSDYDEQVFAMLTAMDQAGRLIQVDEATEKNPGVFAEDADPSIISVEDEED